MSATEAVAAAEDAVREATLAEIAAARSYLEAVAAEDQARADFRAALIAVRDARHERRKDMHAARRQIIDAANTHQHRLKLRTKPYTARTVQQAVCVVRRNRLVKPGVLVTAGYNA